MEACNELRDSLGRRRTPTQNNGLRPLYPPLDAAQRSASVRIAMTERGWVALQQAVTNSNARTIPRAIGGILERALGSSQPVDWQDWQIRKEKQLLGKAS